MTTNPAARTFSSDFKRFFLRGLVVLLPSVLTLWIVVKAYQFVDNTIAEPINGWVRVGMIQVASRWEPLRANFDPSLSAIEAEVSRQQGLGIENPNRARIRSELRAANVRQWWANHWFLDLIGLIVAIVAVYVAGRTLGGFVGRQLYRRLENFFTALPVFKQVYPYVKQVVDFLFSDERPLKFNRVVVTEYPRKGIWSVGFLTGTTMRSIARESGDAVTVFVPSSPTPFTGYTITVPRDEVIELPITVGGGSAALPLGGVEPRRTADESGPTESRRDAG
jgi:uncharacterized membrane protein